jgi:hypothetical protein
LRCRISDYVRKRTEINKLIIIILQMGGACFAGFTRVDGAAVALFQASLTEADSSNDAGYFLAKTSCSSAVVLATGFVRINFSCSLTT